MKAIHIAPAKLLFQPLLGIEVHMNNANLIASYKNGLHRVFVYSDRIELGVFWLKSYRYEEIKSIKIFNYFVGKSLTLVLWNGKTTSAIQMSNKDADACRNQLERFIGRANSSPSDGADEAAKSTVQFNNKHDKNSFFDRSRHQTMSSEAKIGLSAANLILAGITIASGRPGLSTFFFGMFLLFLARLHPEIDKHF